MPALIAEDGAFQAMGFVTDLSSFMTVASDPPVEFSAIDCIGSCCTWVL